MKPHDREKLFEQVQKRFSNWKPKRVSGYVHGVVDGLKREKPRQDYIRGCINEREYSIGYIYGFIDAYGTDALMAGWSRKLDHRCMLLGPGIVDYHWWEK